MWENVHEDIFNESKRINYFIEGTPHSRRTKKSGYGCGVSMLVNVSSLSYFSRRLRRKNERSLKKVKRFWAFKSELRDGKNRHELSM